MHRGLVMGDQLLPALALRHQQPVQFAERQGQRLLDVHVATHPQCCLRQRRVELRRGGNVDDVWLLLAQHLLVVGVAGSDAELVAERRQPFRQQVTDGDQLHPGMLGNRPGLRRAPRPAPDQGHSIRPHTSLLPLRAAPYGPTPVEIKQSAAGALIPYPLSTPVERGMYDEAARVRYSPLHASGEGCPKGGVRSEPLL
jgi:hypothetical protein